MEDGAELRASPVQKRWAETTVVSFRFPIATNDRNSTEDFEKIIVDKRRIVVLFVRKQLPLQRHLE
jgi:hypothetical protein